MDEASLLVDREVGYKSPINHITSLAAEVSLRKSSSTHFLETISDVQSVHLYAQPLAAHAVKECTIQDTKPRTTSGWLEGMAFTKCAPC